MNPAAVMDEVAARLGTIPGLRSFAYTPDNVAPPAAIVGYPTIDFDRTMARGMDSYALPVWVLVGTMSVRASRDAIAPYLAGSGAKSFKSVIEAGVYLSFDTVRVQGAEPSPTSVAGIEYLAYRFTLDIAGTGAT